MENNYLIDDNETFIYYEDEFIDSPEIIEKLLQIKNNNFDTTNISSPWPDYLIPDGVGVVKIWDVNDDFICSYLCRRLAEVFPKLRSNNYKFTFLVHEWQEGSFIPWHNDAGHLCALTCYLDNKTEHGGEFLCKPFDDKTMGMFLEAKINRVVLQKGVYHCVSKIHKGTRTSLQIWGEKINANL